VSEDRKPLLRRRTVLYGGAATVCAGASGVVLWSRNERGMRSATHIARAQGYDEAKLEGVIRDGLATLGLSRRKLAGKRVLLKPNLVEPSRDAPHVNTHPTFVRAVVEVLRRLDCREVSVGEGPGHMRDTQLVLEESGFEGMLKAGRVPFFDLNHDDISPVENRLGFTGLGRLYLPRSLRRFDLVVSMPKMKTHHWAGLTLSMKNLFGVMPGIVYGWPKNVFHVRGISQSVLDIVAAVRPQLAIVDGIVAMEGDGPILGQPRKANLVVLGENCVAVDATCARLMGFDPMEINYLRAASGSLGPIRSGHIEQRGEEARAPERPFKLLDHPEVERFQSARL
jgi:uncharacterized protein (DUF362 family)